VARALDTHRIGYWVHAHGNTQQLSKSLQLSLHRIVYEAVNHLCASHSVSDLTVRIRGGQFGERRWVVVRVDALFASDPALRVHGGPLLYRLGATGLGIDAIKDRVALYDGKVRVRTTEHGELISLMLYEAGVAPERARVARVNQPSTTPAFLTLR
jgi:glucose-6-phosphate-specific signal transduction histidine kinase